MFAMLGTLNRTSAVVVGDLGVVSAYLAYSSKPLHDFELSVEELQSCLSRLRGRTRYTVHGMVANAEPDATWGPEVVGNAAVRRPTIGVVSVQRRVLLRQVLLDFGLSSSPQAFLLTRPTLVSNGDSRYIANLFSGWFNLQIT